MKVFPRMRGIGDQAQAEFIAAVPSVGSFFCDGVAELKPGILSFYRIHEGSRVVLLELPTGNTTWTLICAEMLDLVTEADLYDEAEDQASKMNILRRRLSDEGGGYQEEL